MRWVLSSSAAPKLTLDELSDAAFRKNLDGLELVQGHGHRLESDLTAGPLRFLARKLEDRDLGVAAYRLHDPAEVDPEGAASVAHELETFVVLASAGEMAVDRLEEWVRCFERGGQTLLLAMEDPGELGADWTREVARDRSETIGFAWDAASCGQAADRARRMMEDLGPSLRHIRVPGTGPEAPADGQGRIGSLVAVLTLLGYRGTAALAPSSGATLAQWESWLGRSRGWGCGGAASPREDHRQKRDPAPHPHPSTGDLIELASGGGVE